MIGSKYAIMYIFLVILFAISSCQANASENSRSKKKYRGIDVEIRGYDNDVECTRVKNGSKWSRWSCYKKEA